jgi:hypothetical protein
MTKLPDKPSELILIALEDLEKCEADPIYKIDMGTWHEPLSYSKCEVCAAGAVMAQSLGARANWYRDPDWFEYPICDKLLAINSLRMGKISMAFYLLGFRSKKPDFIEVFNDEDSFDLTELSHFNRAEWNLHMQDLAGVLAAEGY